MVLKRVSIHHRAGFKRRTPLKVQASLNIVVSMYFVSTPTRWAGPRKKRWKWAPL